MKEIKISVKLKAVKLFLDGDTFDDIGKQLGIAKGSVVNIIDDFRNGYLPLPPSMVEYVAEIRRVVVDLKKQQTTIAAVKPCLKIHTRMEEMGVGDKQVEQWLDICQDISSTTVANNQFVQSALELAEATAVNGMDYHSVVEDYDYKLNLGKKLDIENQRKKEQKEQSTAELDTINKAVVTAQDNFEKQKGNLKSQLDEYITQNQLSWEKVNTVAAILNTELGQIGLGQDEIGQIFKQIAENGSLTVTNKQLEEERDKLKAEVDNLKKEKVHFEGSVKSLSNINQKICNSILVRGPQRDELNIIIQEKEAKLEELNQSTLESVTTLFEANLIAAFLVSPKGLDGNNLDKFIDLIMALRQKRHGIGPKQVKDAEGNVICQCLVPEITNLDNKDVDMDAIRQMLALHLMPLVKDKFIPILQHQIEVLESNTSGRTAMLHKLGYQV
ncbi:hypothetical protein ACFLWI_07910 [Chloroflexota bacterium]